MKPGWAIILIFTLILSVAYIFNDKTEDAKRFAVVKEYGVAYADSVQNSDWWNTNYQKFIHQEGESCDFYWNVRPNKNK